jgi:hypothetical protein
MAAEHAAHADPAQGFEQLAQEFNEAFVCLHRKYQGKAISRAPIRSIHRVPVTK